MGGGVLAALLAQKLLVCLGPPVSAHVRDPSVGGEGAEGEGVECAALMMALRPLGRWAHLGEVRASASPGCRARPLAERRAQAACSELANESAN